MKVVTKQYNASVDFDLQRKQYSEKIPLSGSVPAGSGVYLLKTNVSNLGHFKCLRITGRYETLYSTAGTLTGQTAQEIVDDGICHVRASLQDGAGQRIMFSDYVPLDLFLSPGRMRSTTAVNNLIDVAGYANRADAAPQLFYPDEFSYTFQANSDILLYCKNDSNYAISIDLCFHGIRLLSGKAVSGIR